MRNNLAALYAAVNPANRLRLAVMSEVEARLFPRSSSRGPRPEAGRSSFPALLALVVLCGASVLALVAARTSEPLGLILLAVLATVGVFFLFALAAGHVRFGQGSGDEDLLRGMIEADDDGVQVTDSGGRVVAENAAFRRLVGVSGLGDVNALETLLSQQVGGAEALFRLSRAAERGEALVEELMVGAAARSADGAAAEVAQRWLNLSVKPVANPGRPNRPPLKMWRVRDVTVDRQREAQNVGVVSSRLARYMRAPFGLVTAKPDGEVTFLNDRLKQWLGFTGESWSGIGSLRDLVADGGEHLLMAMTTAPPAAVAADAGDLPQCLDLDLVGEAGRRWPATLAVAANYDSITLTVIPRIEEGTAPGRSRAQSERRFSRLFRSAPFGIAAVDASGNIVNANTAFWRLMLDNSTQRGPSLVDVLAKGDTEIAGNVAAALEAARQGKASIPTFEVTLTKEGRKGKDTELTRRIYVTALPKTKSASELAIFYVVDATEAKVLEHRIAQALKMEAVGTLAGGIAHDFNNVLTAIIGFSDLLLQTHMPGNPSHGHIRSIKSSADRAAGLVRQLLAFSRRQTLQPKVLLMSEVLTDLSTLVNQLLGEKIELKIVSGRDLWYVKADPSEIERTIFNLVVNARDAMLPKGGKLMLRTRNIGERESQKLEAQGVARGEYVLIEVEDTGTGMTPEVMAKIFDPFFTTKAVGKGTGLGLASVYGIVQQTGGYIFPDSTPGVGTTFRVYLPRYHVEADEAAQPAAAAAKPRQRDLTGSGRVLLVEDEDAVRRFAVAALKSKGYEVLQASDGFEALEVMKQNGNHVDIVVSDVVMPEMDGPTLLKELRKLDPKLKFIFVSGYPDDAFKNNLDPDADFTFIPKPYSLAQIAAKVKEEIGR